jgi:hypothetical protein
VQETHESIHESEGNAIIQSKVSVFNFLFFRI